MSNRLGPPAPLGERPLRSKMVGHNGPLRFSLRIGEIKRIDYESMVCDIFWLQGRLPPSLEVPLSAPYWSRRGFLGSMPEEGSIVICGFSASHESSGIQPYILTYLPNGFKTALRFDPFGLAERGAAELDVPLETIQKELDGIYGPTRHKMRKIYPGDIYGSSDKGAEFLLDRDVRLLNSGGAEVWLRTEDMALVTNTLDAFSSTAATRKREGRIIRSALLLPLDMKLEPDTEVSRLLANAGIIYPDTDPLPDVDNVPSIVLESGERLGIVTKYLEDPTNPDAVTYTEHRIEIQETSDQTLPFPDHYGFDADLIADEPQWEPFIEKVSGTVVGNDPYSAEGRSLYGQLLKPVLFSGPNATEGEARLEPVRNARGESEASLVAAHLYRMRRPDGLGELFIAHDKEGHVYLSIPASTSKASNLGAGRSVEADIKGSVKMVVGTNKNDNESANIHMKGGVKWSLGTVASTRRSLEMRAGGGVYMKAGRDSGGYSFRGEYEGSVAMVAEGSMGIAVGGDIKEEAGGLRSVQAETLREGVGTGGKDVVIMGDQTTVVKGDEQTSVGGGRETTISTGDEEVTLLKGDRSLTFGAVATNTIDFKTSGTYEVKANARLEASWKSSGVGEYTFQASSGKYDVNMGAGSIKMTSTTLDVKAASSIKLQAPRIRIVGQTNLGTATATNAAVGGVPGPSPYIDPFTGLPLTGNPLVNVP